MYAGTFCYVMFSSSSRSVLFLKTVLATRIHSSYAILNVLIKNQPEPYTLCC